MPLLIFFSPDRPRFYAVSAWRPCPTFLSLPRGKASKPFRVPVSTPYLLSCSLFSVTLHLFNDATQASPELREGLDAVNEVDIDST